MPLATLWGTLIAAVIYILGVLRRRTVGAGLAASRTSSAPFADVVRMFWGDGVASTLSLFAFISGFGALNGWILVAGEMPRVLAKEGVFPKMFARESRHGTPGVSLVISSGLLTVLVLMNYSRTMVQVFTFIILIATSTYLVMYLCCALAALKLCWNGSLGDSGAAHVAILACRHARGAVLGVDAVRRRRRGFLVEHRPVRDRSAGLLDDEARSGRLGESSLTKAAGRHACGSA